MKEEEKMDIKRKCNKFLSGHYPQPPKQFYLAMAQYTDEKERGDLYGDGPGLQAFEKRIAQLLGKEACLFMPSGTMAQVIALKIYAQKKANSQVAFHETSHLELYEEKSYQHLHQLQSELLGEPERVITLRDIKKVKSHPAAILLELPMRVLGGQLPSWNELKEIRAYTQEKNIPLHLDGARIWECAAFYQKTYREIATLFDSVYISFYKGIGALAGAALLGTQDFIEHAKPWLRRHGGNLITQHPFYLSAQKGLEKHLHRFADYYQKTQRIAQVLEQFPEVVLNPRTPQSNMFHLYFQKDKELLEKRVYEYAQKTGLLLFKTLPLEKEKMPGFECYIGECALDLTESEINAAFSFILTS